VEYAPPVAMEGVFTRVKATIQRLINKPFDPPSWTKNVQPFLSTLQRVNHLVFDEDVPHLFIPMDLDNGLESVERGRSVSPEPHAYYFPLWMAHHSPTRVFEYFGKLGL
jgi:hypothetical protein